MGTTFSVVLFGEQRDQLDEAVNAALAEVQRLSELLSIYRPESVWSEINRLA